MELTSRQKTALAAATCEIASDNLTRQLYATDASLYRVEPLAVAFPANALEARSAILAGISAGLPIIPRGAGTGLVGGAIGSGLVVEFSRRNRTISELNLERKTVRVGSGVVLDQLNAYLRPHGYRFGPDVATSSRATLGGMIANNSSGSHVPVYGTTADHVVSLEIILADGRIEQIGPAREGLSKERAALEKRAQQRAAEIAARMPAGLLKRWPGFGLDRFLSEPGNLNHLLAGSEGTLAAILSAELNIVPLPREKGVGLIFFSSVAEAMRATVELLALRPAAIEHIDRVLFDQTKGQLAFQAARDLLELDANPCESILIVEFFDDTAERLRALERKQLGLRTLVLKSGAEMNLVWALRKAGLSLLTGRKGAAKPVTGIEDTAVRPERLPEYVAGLSGIFSRLNLQACFYGHAATGLLHVRPVLDLQSPGDLKKFRQVADEVSALVRQFKGSLAAEHGVGMARTEFMPDHLGPELLALMAEIKNEFDPRHVFNPGKILGSDTFRIDRQLRVEAGPVTLPFEPVLAFAGKDESFLANLDQCNGCGGCRKQTPTMCPTFLATGDELMSTRGRANLIRAALEGGSGGEALLAPELEAALENCLSCKACTMECPSNVNLALLKAELLHARQQRYGISLREQLLSSVDLMGKLGCIAPGLANQLLRSKLVRRALDRWLGFTAARPLPLYATQRFDRWFAARPKSKNGSRGKVLLWDDTFVRYHEPHIGKAAVAVLEAAGFEVMLAEQRRCCGRPAFSQGNLNKARRLGAHNLALLQEAHRDLPIIFLEPSCFSMFAEDYRELKLPGALDASRRSFLFEEFIDNTLDREPGALHLVPGHNDPIVMHGHCHAKALRSTRSFTRLAARLPGRTSTLLETGCCGMAGAFGALTSKYELSRKVAAPLVQLIHEQPPQTTVIASGTSCRHQIEHLTHCKPKHFAEVLSDHLPGSP